MTVLVTGGAGYVGTQLMAQLVKDPSISRIIVYDNLSRDNFHMFLGEHLKEKSSNKELKIELIHGELLDTRKLRMAVKEANIIYHLAAKVVTPFVNSDGHAYEQTNHWGTAELVYAIEESPKVQKLVYLSSTSVYGSSQALVDESSIPSPQTLYGISKLRGEEHVQRLFPKIPTYIMRCGNVYGFNESLRFDAVINRFMFEANFKRRISIHGDGKQRRAFINVQRVGEVLAQLIHTNMPSDIYNLVDKNFQILDIVDVVKAIYFDLEFIFVNRHLGLRELSVDTNLKLFKYLPQWEEDSLLDEMEEFRTRFSF
ncbi:NAD-dependent epimerase/dehydratase family protein [Catalinimonas niigatensis]|uniref:NAD-dependent epimerase/dehydratase family protein n=1 Tax=Catalinimonas niigatensis TaxID=1397264 RepID=UPI0026662BCA|nr:SDR family oxidoreductase [Catalinimonas niigatensis]WPP52229.1 SDR family oxidoreductase [Catalinimonas niigatensis]